MSGITGGDIKEEMAILNEAVNPVLTENKAVQARRNELKKLYVKFRNFLKQHEPVDDTNRQLVTHLHQLMFSVFKGKTSAAKMKAKSIKKFVDQAASNYGSASKEEEGY